MQEKRQQNIIDVIEATLESPLDADLVGRVPSLAVRHLEALNDAYDDFAATFTVPPIGVGEFWPVSHHLIPRDWQRDPKVAETAAQRAMSQLLFAHGAIVRDHLGYLLATALNPRRVSQSGPSWVKSRTLRPRLTNYFEALAYMRPLIDAGLLVLRPRLVRRMVPDPDIDYVLLDADLRPAEAQLAAVEMVRGRQARGKHEREMKNALATAGHYSFTPASTREEEAYQLALESLFAKFDELATNLPGDLNLETPFERRAFEWLGRTAEAEWRGHSDSEALWVMQQIAVPRLTDVQPEDVVAMHRSDAWHEYRLALRRGLQRIQESRTTQREAAVSILREETAGLEVAVQKTTTRSKFVEERARVTEDLTIGAVVTGGATALFGLKGAAAGIGMSTTRSMIALFVAWMRARSDTESVYVSRVFGAFR